MNTNHKHLLYTFRIWHNIPCTYVFYNSYIMLNMSHTKPNDTQRKIAAILLKRTHCSISCYIHHTTEYTVHILLYHHTQHTSSNTRNTWHFYIHFQCTYLYKPRTFPTNNQHIHICRKCMTYTMHHHSILFGLRVFTRLYLNDGLGRWWAIGTMQTPHFVHTLFRTITHHLGWYEVF